MQLIGNLTLEPLGASELQNVICERLSTAPSLVEAEEGRIYYNTVDGVYYYNNGTSWAALATGGNTAGLQDEVNAIETSLGAGVNSNGTFNSSAFTDVPGVLVDPTSFTNAINQIAAAATSIDSLGDVNDVQISSITDKDLLQWNSTTSKWENKAVGTASGVQGYDAGLASLAAMSTNGLVAATANNVFTPRAITAPAAGISITNGDGVSGNPTLSLSNDLAALENLSSTGISVRTGSDTWATRSVSGGSGRIVISNGDGVSGNLTVDLATVINTNTGTLQKLSIDSYGRVTGTAAIVASDITGLVDSAYVNVSGDSMAGTLAMNNNPITGVPTPTNPGDAVNKAYADALIQGLSWKNPVRVATTANIDLTTGGLLTIDGITVADGDRVLVRVQSTPSQNGIYTATTGAWARALDMNSTSPNNEFTNASVFVRDGTTYADTQWVQTATISTIGSDSVTWVQTNAASGVTDGAGLTLSGSVMSVNFGAGIQQLPTDEVGIHLYSYTSNSLGFADGTGTRRASEAAAVSGDTLRLFLDGSSLSQSGSGLRVANTGITETHLNASVAGNGLGGGAGSPLSVNVDNSTIEINTDTLRIKDSGVTNAKLANPSFSIRVLDLANSPATIDVPVTLGGHIQLYAGSGMRVAYESGQIRFTSVETLAGLDDVTITSIQSSQAMVWDSGTSRFVNKYLHHVYTSGGPSTSHTVNHNLGQKYCNVTVVDSSDEVIIPQSIVFNSANQLTVTFTASINCKVIVSGI